jgi:hypothetical protein
MRALAKVALVAIAMSTVAAEEAQAADRPNVHDRFNNPSKPRKSRGVPELTLAGGTGALIVIGGAAWLLMRRKREDDAG